MSNEISVTASLTISKDNLSYQNSPRSFRADMTTAAGPTPGLVVATPLGQTVDLSLLTTPGMCCITNINDGDVYVEVGIWDVTNSIFFPLMEVLPGESYVIRLSRSLGLEEAGAGSGSTGSGNSLMLRCNSQTANVKVEAFEA